MIALNGGKVAICSTIQLVVYSQHYLITYSLQGKESKSITLEQCPDGLAQVTLGGKPCLVVSYRYQWGHSTQEMSHVSLQ